jgi:hypothetical protein
MVSLATEHVFQSENGYFDEKTGLLHQSLRLGWKWNLQSKANESESLRLDTCPISIGATLRITSSSVARPPLMKNADWEKCCTHRRSRRAAPTQKEVLRQSEPIDPPNTCLEGKDTISTKKPTHVSARGENSCEESHFAKYVWKHTCYPNMLVMYVWKQAC